MSEIQVYNSEQFGDIRTAGTAEAPLFCLADICKVLDLQTGATKNRLDPKGVSLINTPTAGGMQQMYYVSEQNLYKVIMRSDKPQAEPFQDWVCGEVLPTIRRHGMYATTATIENIIADPDSGIQLLRALKQERQEKLAAEAAVQRLEAQAIEAKPKVVYADAVQGSTSSCLIGELAKIEVKEVDLWTELGNYIEHYRNRETGYTMFGIAKHFFELGLKTQKGK